MKKIAIALTIILAVAVSYGIGWKKGTERTRLYLAEQYIQNQILECSFDLKGINRIKDGKEDGIGVLEDRIRFRMNDLNYKLEKEAFWKGFVPSCLEQAGTDLTSDEIHQSLKNWNESYQAKLIEKYKIDPDDRINSVTSLRDSTP